MSDEPTPDRSTPMLYGMRKLFAAEAPYRPLDRLIVFAVVVRMNTFGICWPSLADISKRTALSKRTVTKFLGVHLNGPAPLLARSWVPGRRSPTYTLVRDPIAFAAARDSHRDEAVHEVPPKTRGDREGVHAVHPKTREETAPREMHEVHATQAQGAPQASATCTSPMHDTPPKTSMKTSKKKSATTPDGASLPRFDPVANKKKFDQGLQSNPQLAAWWARRRERVTSPIEEASKEDEIDVDVLDEPFIQDVLAAFPDAELEVVREASHE